MIKIWKYPIPGRCTEKVKQILTVDIQYGKPVVWVVIDDNLEKETSLAFYTVGTGWEMTGEDEDIFNKSIYMGTVKDEEGYIWHCYCTILPAEQTEKNVAESDSQDVER